MTNIYSVQPTASCGVSVNSLPSAANLNLGYTSLTTVVVGNDTLLYAYNRGTMRLDVYKVTDAAPYFTKVVSDSTALDLFQWDSLKSFVLGNIPYLMAYEKTKGNFAFYAVNSDYSLSTPYTFMNQRSWPTQNFSEVSPFVAVGELYILCYDGEKGTVAIFNLNVVATSSGGIPPLNMLNSWYHEWAKSWTNFAFFTLGQSNFFFKINKGKLNVNIDHVLDSPALGTVEIGSYLQHKLPNAKDVILSSIIPWTNGEPYLATFAPGETGGFDLNTYKIQSDCQGWTHLNLTNPPSNATSMLSYMLGDKSFLLLYSAI